ncbi:MAG: helix-turn-helix transcriptional regulator [Peptococcaceae bacterium]|nr:helix-turn-helix transcriptional regulator [Peptococcaceae bacterium]
MQLGRRIRYLRKEQKLSQTQLGKKLNLAESTISLYESGKRSPDFDTLLKIAAYFNVSLDYLFGLTDSRHQRQYRYEEETPYFSEQSFLSSDGTYYGTKAESQELSPNNFWYRVGTAESSDHGFLTGDLLLIDPCPLEPEAGNRMLVQLSLNLPPRFYYIAQYGDPTILMPLDIRQKPEVLTYNTRKKLPLFGKVLELRRSF